MSASCATTRGANGRYQLWAVLDELTLTYSVIVRAPDGGFTCAPPTRRVAARGASVGRRLPRQAVGGPGRPSDSEHGPCTPPDNSRTADVEHDPVPLAVPTAVGFNRFLAVCARHTWDTAASIRWQP